MRLIAFILVFLISSQCFADPDESVEVPKPSVEEYEKYFALAEYFIEIDSLKARNEIDKINLLNTDFPDSSAQRIGLKKIDFFANHFSDRDVIVEIKALQDIARQKDDSLYMAELSSRLSDVYMETSQFYLAIEEIDFAKAIYENRNLEEEVGALLLKKGAAEYSIGDYINSIETVFEAADKFKGSDSRVHLAYSYLQVGITYSYIEKYSTAIKNFGLAKNEFLNVGDTLGAEVCNLNTALVYLETEQYDTALTIYRAAKPVVYKSNRRVLIGQMNHYIGNSFIGLLQYDSAKYYLNLSLKNDTQIGYDIGMSSNYTQLSYLHKEIEDIDSALYYGRKSLEMLEQTPDIDNESIVTHIMAECLLLRKQYHLSAKYYNRHIELQDTIQRERKVLDQIAQDQAIKIESYREKLFLAKQREELIAQENQNQRQLITGMSIFGVIMIGLLILVSVINQRNRKLNQKLIENQHVIEEDLAVKKSLLKEIHHRVKNNLQVISSMLSIQTQYVSDPILNNVIEECKSRITSMALIHESLYKRDTNDITSFSSYIKNLIPQLINTYQVDENKVKLTMDVEDIELSIDESVPCGLLLNEVISNSLKHAFPDDRNGEINIKMFKKRNTIFLSIADNGIGLPQNIDPTEQDSFGFLLIYTLASQLDASMKIDRDNGLSFDFSWQVKSYEMLA